MDRLPIGEPLRSVFGALLAFFGVITVQFFRARGFADRLPDQNPDALGLDPTASFPMQLLSYLGNGISGEWGTSLWHSEPVTTVLLAALPSVGLVVGVSVASGLVAEWAWSRFTNDRFVDWTIPYGVYLVVFLVAFVGLIGSSTEASGLYLTQSRRARDIPLLIGARRLIAFSGISGVLGIRLWRHYVTDVDRPRSGDSVD